MGKLAYVFPGQGSQYVGMGRALYEKCPEAKAVFDAADEALGEKLSKLVFEGPEEDLKLTRNTHPAILTVSVAMHAVLRARTGETPDLLAGHSLGEYSALVASGALDLADAVRAVRQRGAFMQEAVPAGVGAMAAVVRVDPELVKAGCAEVAQNQVCSPANFNSPDQTVIAGHAEAVERARAKLAAAAPRARVLPLPVSAPFHCALMEPVAPRMRTVLEGLRWSALAVPVVTNVEAAPNADPKRAVELLVAQVTSPVRWVESVKALAAAGVTRVVEVGPGKVLTGLVKAIDKGLEATALDEPEALAKLLGG
ncbi:MAG: ACP S-malonyltransferase [Myxococcales bacterium]